MLTWKRGRELVFENLQKHAIPLEDFLSSLFVAPPTRVYGTAIFLRGESDGVPHALLHNLSHNKVLHERVVFFTVHVAKSHGCRRASRSRSPTWATSATS
jgi:KUP system potassium uptake protein